MKQQLSDLSERELLILLNEKVGRLEHDMSAHQATSNKLEHLEHLVIELKVKYQVWVAIIGFLASLGGGIIQKLINF
jgi:hypothetical protein